MKTGIALFVAGLVVWSGANVVLAKRVEGQKPVVQIALLLDTSGSMQGLIDQAKTQLWKVVNEFATARQDGQVPDLYVALYHYGSPSLGAENGYVRQIVPLTQDLDKVSQELFALTISGGDEYCGTVVAKAVEQLAWSNDPTDYKAIFIAGNEPFTQGGVDYKQSCKAAIEKGIIVNTIHCGKEDLPEELKKLPAEQRQACLDQKLAEREQMQKEINELNAARQAHVDTEMKKFAAQTNGTLDEAIINAMRQQAQAKHFEFKAPTTQQSGN